MFLQHNSQCFCQFDGRILHSGLHRFVIFGQYVHVVQSVIAREFCAISYGSLCPLRLMVGSESISAISRLYDVNKYSLVGGVACNAIDGI